MALLKNAARLTVLAALLVGASACSRDKHKFQSRMWQPLTLSLYDTLSDNLIWTKEIPVDYNLYVDFDRPVEFELFYANMEPATKMSWELYKVDTVNQFFSSPTESGKLELSGAPIKMVLTVRKSPEFPPGYHAQGHPATQPDTTTAPVTTTEVPPASKPPPPELLPTEAAPAPTSAPATSTAPAPETPGLDLP